MPMFRVACPDCQKSFKVQLPDTAERGKVTCPFCHTSFVVTAPSLADASSDTPQPMPAIPEASVVPHPSPADSGRADLSAADASQTGGLSSFLAASLPSESPAAELCNGEKTAVAAGVSAPIEKQAGESPSGGSLSDALDLWRRTSPSALSTADAAAQSDFNPYAPPQAAVSVATETTCPVCGRADKNYTVRGKTLYGQKVCRKCYNSFLNRRQLAFCIDSAIYNVLSFAVSFFQGLVIGVIVDSSVGEVDEWQLVGIEATFVLIYLGLFVFWFLLKDGFNGASPGKAVMGLRVIDETRGCRIGLAGSAKRNWPIVLLGIIPFAWVIIGAFLGPGYRIGDKMAGTKVIWKKYASSPVFAPRLHSLRAKLDDVPLASQA